METAQGSLAPKAEELLLLWDGDLLLFHMLKR